MSIDQAITKSVRLFDPADKYADVVMTKYPVSESRKRKTVIEGDVLVYHKTEKKAAATLDGMPMRMTAEKVEFLGLCPLTTLVSGSLVPCVIMGTYDTINNSPFSIVIGTRLTFVHPSLGMCTKGERVQMIPLETSRASVYCRFEESDLPNTDRYRLMSEVSLRIHGGTMKLEDKILVPVRVDTEQFIREDMKVRVGYWSTHLGFNVEEQDIDRFHLFVFKRRKKICISHAIAATTAVPGQVLRLVKLA